MQERLDDAASTSSTSSTSRVSVVCPIEQHLIMDHSYASSLTKSRGVEEEFLDLAHEETKARKKAKEAMAEKLPPATVPREPIAEDNNNEGDGDGGGWEDFDAGGGDDAFGGQDDDDDPLPDPHANDMQVLGSMLDDPAAVPGSSKEAEEEGDSYEELVMKRVAAYVQQSQEYIESTDLAKKVSRWHESIGPRLERVERRAAFDVHEYGTHILAKFPGQLQQQQQLEEEEEQAQPDADAPRRKGRKTTTTFAAVVEGKDREEVCRYFLSSLMLANTYNIELAHGGGASQEPAAAAEEESPASRGSHSPGGKKRDEVQSDPGALPMDDIEMHLLSMRRVYHELYEDPPPPPSPRQAVQGNSAGKTGKQSGSNNPQKAPRPKKGGAGKAKNRFPSKRPSVEMDDVAVLAVNGLEH